MRLRHIPDSASTLSTAFLASSKRIQDTWRKRIPTDKAFPAWGRWRAKRAGWGTSGMKKSEENRLKCVVYESTRAPLRGPPSPMGKATTRGYRFSRHNAFPKGEGKEEAASPPKKEANPASLRSAAPSKGRGSRGQSLLPMEGGAPKGRRLDGGSGMKEREIVSSTPLYESTLSTAIPISSE